MKFLTILLLTLFSVTSFSEETVTERIQPLIQAEDVQVSPPIPVASKDSIKESEIPVRLSETKKSHQIESPWLRMVFTLAILGILAGTSLLYIKRKKGLSQAMGPVPEVKLLTQFHLGPKKSLAIIRVAGESILIGVTDHNINLIKGLSFIDEEIPSQLPNKFVDALDESEEFSIKGIQDVVSEKLKNMRSIQ